MTPSPTSPAPAVGSLRLESATRVAGAWSLLCAIHCLATPFFVAAFPFLGLAWGGEVVVCALTTVLGFGLTWLGPGRTHPMLLGVLGVGATLWAASLAGLFEPWPEHFTSAAGSAVFAGGILWGAFLCREGECALCDEHACHVGGSQPGIE